MKSNIIYVLNCPITNKPVYVGKSTQGVERPFLHIAEKSHSEKVNRWVKYLKEKGRDPQVYLVEMDVDDKLLEAKETFWINYYVTKGNLLLNQKGIDPALLYTHNDEDIEDPLRDIRSFIINKRKLMKLTQTDLARKSGVGLKTIRDIEQGKKTNFHTKPLLQVLKLLGNVKIGVIDDYKWDDKISHSDSFTS
jgi:DNA-binding XRE family transcriptional regulator